MVPGERQPPGRCHVTAIVIKNARVFDGHNEACAEGQQILIESWQPTGATSSSSCAAASWSGIT